LPPHPQGCGQREIRNPAGQFKIFLELGYFLLNSELIDGVFLTSVKLPQYFGLIVVMCDVFLAEVVAKQRLTHPFSIVVGRQGDYAMARGTEFTKRPWETRLRQFLHAFSPLLKSAGS
jgi:hypothetical protein